MTTHNIEKLDELLETADKAHEDLEKEVTERVKSLRAAQVAADKKLSAAERRAAIAARARQQKYRDEQAARGEELGQVAFILAGDEPAAEPTPESVQATPDPTPAPERTPVAEREPQQPIFPPVPLPVAQTRALVLPRTSVQWVWAIDGLLVGLIIAGLTFGWLWGQVTVGWLHSTLVVLWFVSLAAAGFFTGARTTLRDRRPAANAAS